MFKKIKEKMTVKNVCAVVGTTAAVVATYKFVKAGKVEVVEEAAEKTAEFISK